MDPYRQFDPTQDPRAAAGPQAPVGRGSPPLSQAPANLWGGQDNSRAFIDRIEGDPGREMAVVMMGKNGENVFNVPLQHLPKGVKEGQWIDLGTSPYDNKR